MNWGSVMSLKQQFQEGTVSNVPDIKEDENWGKGRVPRRPIFLNERDREKSGM